VIFASYHAFAKHLLITYINILQKPKPKAKAKAAPKAKANTKAKADPAPKKAAAKPSASSSGGDLDGKTVIITGTIPGHDRKSAAALLEAAGATIAKSLNKSVELVIIGSDPGPDKLQKIEDMGVETIPWADVAEKLGVEAEEPKKAPSIEVGDAPDSVSGKTLIITGNIEGMTRPAVQKLLEAEGATFAKSLNKSVELVVLGAKPGPDKLAKIKELGIETVSFEDLAAKLGLEVDAPPKKKAKKT
jgi:NAD-dependent DNA ligase